MIDRAIKFKRKNKPIDYLIKIVKFLVLAILVAYCISLVYPILWMLINSFKDEFDYGMDLFGFPSIWKFSNYPQVIKFLKIPVRTATGITMIGIGTMAYNSFFRAIFMPLISIMFKSACAYCLAKYKFPGNKFIYNIGIIVMILPIIGALPSALTVHKAIGTYNNMYLFALISPNNIFGMDFLIFYGAFKMLSWEYAEAGLIDGAGNWTIFLKIMLPMQLPLLVVYFILGFLGTWNDYASSLIWMPSYPNLSYGLYYFQLVSQGGSEGTNSPMLFAGYALIMLPSAILYLLCHKVIISKMTVGGLKG